MKQPPNEKNLQQIIKDPTHPITKGNLGQFGINDTPKSPEQMTPQRKQLDFREYLLFFRVAFFPDGFQVTSDKVELWRKRKSLLLTCIQR